MGCIYSKSKNEAYSEPQAKTYSWDVRRSANCDPKDFSIENLHSGEVVRLPGSVNGQQFLVQNCTRTTIFILDYLNTITIDDCNDCTIVLGSVSSSVFLRNCAGCICVAACGQFRTRDCRKCSVHLYSATQPIIEASTRMRFGTYHLTYKLHEDHLKQAKLNPSIQTWTDIHDFTPVETEHNWSFLKEGETFALRTLSNSVYENFIDLDVRWNNKRASLIVLESTV